jgi:hypothetical protein
MDQATVFFCKIDIKNKKLSNEITIPAEVCVTASAVNRQPSTVNNPCQLPAILSEISTQFRMTIE